MHSSRSWQPSSAPPSCRPVGRPSSVAWAFHTARCPKPPPAKGGHAVQLRHHSGRVLARALDPAGLVPGGFHAGRRPRLPPAHWGCPARPRRPSGRRPADALHPPRLVPWRLHAAWRQRPPPAKKGRAARQRHRPARVPARGRHLSGPMPQRLRVLWGLRPPHAHRGCPAQPRHPWVWQLAGALLPPGLLTPRRLRAGRGPGPPPALCDCQARPRRCGRPAGVLAPPGPMPWELRVTQGLRPPPAHPFQTESPGGAVHHQVNTHLGCCHVVLYKTVQ